MIFLNLTYKSYIYFLFDEIKKNLVNFFIIFDLKIINIII